MTEFNYEEELKKRERKLQRLHQAFEEQDLDSGGLQDLKKDAFKYCMYGDCDSHLLKNYLMEKYGQTVILYFGTDPKKIDAVLDALWNTPYYDWDSEQEYTFGTWAKALENERSRQLYRDLVDLKNAWKKMYYEVVEKYNRLKMNGIEKDQNNKKQSNLET